MDFETFIYKKEMKKADRAMTIPSWNTETKLKISEN